MFAEPTINDYINLLHQQAEVGRRRLAAAVSGIETESTKAGRYQSGTTIKRIVDAVEATLESVIAGMHQELIRGIETTKFDPSELRSIAAQRLDDFLLAAISVGKIDDLKGWGGHSARAVIDQRIDDMKTMISHRWRQFDVGFSKPQQPLALSGHVVYASNNMGTVQVGTGNAVQHVMVNIDRAAIAGTIAIVERELQIAELPHDPKSAIQAEIDTVKAQLSKAEPNRTILREAGKTLRNVAEGIAGGILTAPATQAFSTLAGLLGA